MKKRIAARSRAEIEAAFPLGELVEGWFFRVTETSAGAFVAEGSDRWGRTVSRRGSDYDQVLERCVADADGIRSA